MLVASCRKPRDALQPKKSAERARTWTSAEGGVKALRMKRALRAEDEGGDAILDRLGSMLMLARLHKPLRVLLRLFELEACVIDKRSGESSPRVVRKRSALGFSFRTRASTVSSSI